MFFSVITKNSNWKILNKNLVTFKKWDEVKDERLLEFTEKSYFYGKEGFTKNQYIGALP